MKETKMCAKCEETKKLTEFYKHKGRKGDGYGSYCRACSNAINSSWQKDNREKASSAVKAYRMKAKQEHLDYLSTHPCTICGESDPVVLEFHHLNGDKVKGVGFYVVRGLRQLAQEEREKCQVVCANCHKRITAKEFGWYKYAQQSS